MIPVEPGGRLQILVIDDDPKCVELIALHIDGLASSLFRAYGGQEGIDIAKKELPDLIVLDLLMPDVSGFDVVDALHDDPATSSIPILVVTSKSITAEDRDKLNGFVSTVMEKADFSGTRFATEIRRAMSGREARV
jgi:CheY-like chemotaxis protein